MKKPRKWVAGVVALVLLVGAPACVFREEDDDPELVQASAQVEAFDTYFRNTTVVLEPEVEATVTLVNNGSALHSFTVTDFDVEVEAEGATSASVTFVTPTTPGAYEFFCKYHPEDMTGALTIGSDAEAVPEETEVEVETEVEEEDEDVDY
ncbi:MAG TPA: cupredoxin domain-containing protein [Actinomycetota bacterium]|nr:cupredoxin domain-containing protein [Actinomycetota bacterium]